MIYRCSGTCQIYQPITRGQIVDSSKLKDVADDNFKFDENGRKLSKWVENTVRKGEIARYEQFLLFPQCFQKACFPGASKGVIVWEWVTGISRLLGHKGLWENSDDSLKGFIFLSPLSVVSPMIMWESSQWLGKNIVQSTG